MPFDLTPPRPERPSDWPRKGMWAPGHKGAAPCRRGKKSCNRNSQFEKGGACDECGMLEDGSLD